ncbi:unnamed protein product [Durusdinium trenchii]|uniref:Uncharacterized protein n=1 Tax=Durusdinium trenchii TaxID=1381693 RepID=A0ABP0M9M0_9DINO
MLGQIPVLPSSRPHGCLGLKLAGEGSLAPFHRWLLGSEEPTTQFRSKSVPCSPLQKSLQASASLQNRIKGGEVLRCERAVQYLEAARATANFLEKSSILNDLAKLDIARDVEGLDDAKRNLEVVQMRLKVREAFIFESFATRKLKECLKLKPIDERRWLDIEDAIDAAESVLPRLQDAQLSRAKKLEALHRRALNQWQLGIMDRLEQVVEDQDLERLEDLRVWLTTSGADQRDDAQELVQTINQLCKAFEALKYALEEATGPAFRRALWASEEAKLDVERCEMLQRVDRGYGPIRRLNVARWAMLAARRQGSKDLLETALPLALQSGLNVDSLYDALSKYDDDFYDRLKELAQLTRATRRENVKQLEAAIERTKPGDQRLGRRTSLEKLFLEVRTQALETLFDAKQKAKVRDDIKISLTKRSTQVLQEMPLKMKEAAKLRMSKDLRQASSTYKRAVFEKDIRTAISLSDSHALRSALARAEKESSIEGMEDMLASARAALHEMSHLEAARDIVGRASTLELLESNLQKLIQENFPDGLKPQSALGRVEAELQNMKEKMKELQVLLETPLAFENNNTLLQEAGMRQMRLVMDILKLHPYFVISIEYGQAHIASERAKTVYELFRKGCRNPLAKKQLKEKSKVVKLNCQLDHCTPELKQVLNKMLIKCAL